jgi:hypothetical protein
MERCKNKSGSDPSYPHIRAFLRRYGRRAGAGLVAGVVATSAGCDWLTGGVLAPKPEADTGYHLDGMIAETAETWSLELPLDGARDLYFSEPYGWIQYRLALVVDGTPLYDWLFDNPDTALAAVDAVLGAEAVTVYEHDDGFEQVEGAIAAALLQAYQAATGSDRGQLVDVELSILAYEDEDDILGDMETTK